MARWTQLYDELAGPRYPALIAYVLLLTEDQDAADALVASALRRTFTRPKKLTGVREAEHLVRSAIVNGFFSAANDQAPEKSRGDAQGAEGAPAPVQDLTPGERETPAPDINPYAPPGDDAPAPPASPEPVAHPPEPARASAVVARDAADAPLRAALAALPPRARAVAVLRHHDGLTPGQISTQLGTEIATVRALLREVSETVMRELGLDVTDDGADNDDHAGVEIAVADHAGRR